MSKEWMQDLENLSSATLRRLALRESMSYQYETAAYLYKLAIANYPGGSENPIARLAIDYLSSEMNQCLRKAHQEKV